MAESKEEQIAEALEIEVSKLSVGQLEEYGSFEDWLASAEGEKAIRQRVRELCRERNLLIAIELHPKGAELFNLHDLNLSQEESKRRNPIWFVLNPENDIWEEALLWLAEKGENIDE